MTMYICMQPSLLQYSLRLTIVASSASCTCGGKSTAATRKGRIYKRKHVQNTNAMHTHTHNLKDYYAVVAIYLLMPVPEYG